MLSDEQIEQLFTFCKKHHVGHYDVQVELVDHLANAIEERMAKDKNLSFEAALTGVHASFGVLGFAGVVNARSLALEKQYRKMKWQLFLSYFTWPKAALTVCLFLAFSFPIKFLSATGLSFYTTILTYLLFGFEVYVGIRSIILTKKQSRKLMMTYAGPQQTWFLSFCLIQFIGIDFYDLFKGSPVKSFIEFEVVMLIAVIIFVGVMAFRDVINQLHTLARKQYPEAYIVAK